MTNEGLPKFQKRTKAAVLPLVYDAIGKAHVVDVQVYPDGHFRVIFKETYFKRSDGQEAPSKSQWGTLKKRLKRRDSRLFVFKESGKINNTPQQEACYFLDFGFFAADDF